MMLRKGLALHYRLTTAAADKASVFTKFMAVAGEEEEAAGRRRRTARGRDVSLSFYCWKKKNDLGKWDRNDAHRNSSLGPEKHGAVILHVLEEDSDTGKTTGRGKGKRAEVKDELSLYVVLVPSTIGCDVPDYV